MPEIKKLGSDAGLFIYNGLEYNKGLFKIFYNNVEISAGAPDLTKVSVGLKYTKDNEVLASPAVFGNWINGDTSTPFASYSDLIVYLSQAVGIDFSAGGGAATETTMLQVEANTNGSGSYSHEEVTSVTPIVYATNTYKEITFVVEEGSVTANIDSNNIVYTSSDKSIGYSFIDNSGVSGVLTLTLAASSKVRIITKLV